MQFVIILTALIAVHFLYNILYAYLVLHILLSSFTENPPKKLLLVDVDCGTDDAQAILMAIAAPHVKILGITCVGGNTKLENVCKNVLRVLKLCDRLDVSNSFVPIL